MSELVPLYRPTLKREWRVSGSRKHRTVGGVRGKCQSSSQEIMQPHTLAAVEGCPEAQPAVEGSQGGGETPPAPVGSAAAGAGGAACAGASVAGGAPVSGAGGASCSVAGSTPGAVGAGSVGGASSALPAGATGASVSAGRPPAAGRPGRRTSM